MEEYEKVLIINMPLFLMLFILQELYAISKKDKNASLINSVRNIMFGQKKAVKDFLRLTLILTSISIANPLPIQSYIINAYEKRYFF